ncbi:hypothetical protein GGP72_001886 [Salinibacter ruber]|uniref:DUF4359 domain-containing protein n=1 Tax=Salinibacter ruber TaxID=146919 RepID=A0A9X2PYS2_9BACT|nr:DUF4359 domain-containing protein [Salinibacter ruber]MCS3677958.1 hypothetical protein [Salinibacter ruber]MCS3681245.1 hypothetical protein [Salinibacter ruber]
MKALFVALVLVAGGLIATNPGMEAFQSFVRTQAADRIEREVGAGALGDLLGGAGGELLADNASTFTERRSYLVGSVYTVDLDGDGDTDGRVLGVARQFIVIDEFEGDD